MVLGDHCYLLDLVLRLRLNFQALFDYWMTQTRPDDLKIRFENWAYPQLYRRGFLMHSPNLALVEEREGHYLELCLDVLAGLHF